MKMIELYDKKYINSRIERLLFALCEHEFDNLPNAESRIEIWIIGIINNQLPDIRPESRIEYFLESIITKNTSNLPIPQSRIEILFDKLARQDSDLSEFEEPKSRIEILLYYLIQNMEISDIEIYLGDEFENIITDEYDNYIGWRGGIK